MAQYNVHEAKSNLSKLLDRVEKGEIITLARNGKPIARIVGIASPGLVLGSGKNDPNVNVNATDDWWKAMSDADAEAFLEGR